MKLQWDYMQGILFLPMMPVRLRVTLLRTTGWYVFLRLYNGDDTEE